MKQPEKNEIVIALQSLEGMKMEGRLQADGKLVCTWLEAVNIVDDAFLFLLRNLLESKKKKRHVLNAKPLQTVHS